MDYRVSMRQEKLTAFTICDDCGGELHKGEVVLVNADKTVCMKHGEDYSE